MDYLSLYLTAKLLSLPYGRKTFVRMLVAASCGGLYGVLAVYFEIGGIRGAGLTLAVSLFMTVVAFGFSGGFFPLFRSTCTVWGCGTLIGGIITALSGAFFGEREGGVFDIICAAAIASAAVVSLLRRRLARGYAEVSFVREGHLWQGKGLVDSGNLLSDPVGGYPVLLLTAEAARSILKEETDTVYAGHIAEASHGVRVVPMHTVAGTRLLYGFLCREITVCYGKRKYLKSAVICIDHGTNAKEGYSGCEVLLPAALLF